MDGDSDAEYEFMKPAWKVSVPVSLQHRFQLLRGTVQAHFTRRSLIPKYVAAILDAALNGRITDKQLLALETYVWRVCAARPS